MSMPAVLLDWSMLTMLILIGGFEFEAVLQHHVASRHMMRFC